MLKRKVNLTGLALVAAVALSAAVVTTSAVAQDKTQDRTQLRTQDQIYGSQFMTDGERNEYQARMRSMKTEQEREAYRLEHHKQMQERARAKGVSLPDEPPARGAGPGPRPAAGGGAGGGMGGGMGGGPGGKK
ncbi:MAG: hypothetical protein Q7T10_11110 [Rhodoferax sp.]|uniref:hypothetical protein n=1 Tax=Rhodoferax sp. TaxID=50421 RepID=UPI002728BB7D|nr:hypothetical protein [Rhodoferax sp.]MDO8449340.1 hypothetical protein [Rhodoferax sp.]